jgi:hypothetical protein
VIQSPWRTCKQACRQPGTPVGRQPLQYNSVLPAAACRLPCAAQPPPAPPAGCSGGAVVLPHQADWVCHEVVCHVSILLTHHVHVACTGRAGQRRACTCRCNSRPQAASKRCCCQAGREKHRGRKHTSRRQSRTVLQRHPRTLNDDRGGGLAAAAAGAADHNVSHRVLRQRHACDCVCACA